MLKLLRTDTLALLIPIKAGFLLRTQFSNGMRGMICWRGPEDCLGGEGVTKNDLVDDDLGSHADITKY